MNRMPSESTNGGRGRGQVERPGQGQLQLLLQREGDRI